MNKLDRPAPGGGGLRADASPEKPIKAPVGGAGGGIRAAPGRSGGLGGGAGGNAFDNVPIGKGAKNAPPMYADEDDDAGYGGGGSAPPPNTVPCRKCGRNFAEDRIGKHEKTCKVNAKPKKVKMFHKPITEKEKAKMDAVKEKTSKWRAQHEEFVQAMKYNRKMTEVTAKGGNIRDLPPPPPSSQVGMVTCPYCGRKFGEAPAAKHIPSCKNTINKPKPPPGRPAPTQTYGNDRDLGGGYGRPAQPAYPTSTSTGVGGARKPAATNAGFGGAGGNIKSSGYGGSPTSKPQAANPGLGRGNSGEFGGYGGMGGMGAARPTGQNAPVRPSGGMGGGIGGISSSQTANYRKKF